jgi:hypothetical protein
MISTRTLLALSATAFVAACASPDMPGTTATQADQHAALHPAAAASAPTAAMHDRMKAMREMHDKMAQAKTPEERQALMADHMKAMQGGMQMMRGMGGIGGMGGAACMADPQGPPADMGKCQQLMEQRMDMMQMMMEMMMQRMPATPPAGR